MTSVIINTIIITLKAYDITLFLDDSVDSSIVKTLSSFTSIFFSLIYIMHVKKFMKTFNFKPLEDGIHF